MNASKKYALFIGRWQPFHNGHKWLIDQKLSEGIPVAIAVRDTPVDDSNPLTPLVVAGMIRAVYHQQVIDDDVKVIVIPDIESVNYGRKVGYAINEHEPPPAIHFISATEIRRQIKAGEEEWKEKIDSSIHNWLQEDLG